MVVSKMYCAKTRLGDIVVCTAGRERLVGCMASKGASSHSLMV